MRVLLVKPYAPLALSKDLMDYFLHLEPLELEIVAGAVPEEDQVEIIDLSFEKKPFDALKNKLLSHEARHRGLYRVQQPGSPRPGTDRVRQEESCPPS